MNLFGISIGLKASNTNAQRPALPRTALFAGVAGGDDRLPRGYPAQARAAYADNPVAQRAVRLIAEAVGSAPITCADPAIIALLQTRSAGQPLLETCASQLLLHGNAYIQLIAGATAAPGALPEELFALRPERVAIMLDGQGWPMAYTYRSGTTETRLSADDMLGRPVVAHARLLNPLADHYGMGCLPAALRPIAVHNAAMQWNQALLDNAARPSGALIYDPGEPGASLSPAQFERLQAELAAQFQGAGNAGRPMLLDGGLKWQSLSLSPAELDFIALKDSAARDIAMAFGVPPMLLGLTGDATYANYREASKALWRQTVLPIADTLLKSIGQALGGWGAQHQPTVALDRVLALADDREAIWAQVSAANFLTDAEKRVMLGVDQPAAAAPAPTSKAGEKA